MVRMLIMLLFMANSVVCYAKLPNFVPKELYERSDLVVVGLLTGDIGVAANGEKAAIMQVLFYIKGDGPSEIHVCDDNRDQEGLRVTKNPSKEKEVFFLKKIDGCYIGAFGYKSLAYLYPGSSCIVTLLAYESESLPNDLEPLDVFITNLTGKPVVLPSSLTSTLSDYIFPILRRSLI